MLLDAHEQTTCPRCGSTLTAHGHTRAVENSETPFMELTDATQDDIDRAKAWRSNPPPAIAVDRPPVSLNYADDGRPLPPTGSSLSDPYGRTNGHIQFRWREWIMPLLSPRAMMFALFMFMPLSCFGLTISGMGLLAGSMGEFPSNLNLPMVVGFLLCLPNFLLCWIWPSLYVPIDTHSVFLFYTIQFFYFYSLGLFARRVLRHW